MSPATVSLFLRVLLVLFALHRVQGTETEDIVNEIKKIAEAASQQKQEMLAQIQEFKEELKEEVRSIINKAAEQQIVQEELATFKRLLDTDECLDQTHNCSMNANCYDTRVSYRCTCLEGYTGDGYTCEDLDECEAEEADCGPDATCINEVGKYSCQCNEGFTMNNGTCEDINECSEGSNRCHEYAICENTPGNYTCKCSIFHRGDGYECEEIEGVGCDSPFELVPGVGCLHVVTTNRNFDNSRENCQSLGGDLFVALNPDHYKRLAKHFIDTNQKAIDRYLYVGVKEGKWLNGRPVSPEEEAPENPSMGSGTCSYTDGDTGEDFLLWTDPCSTSWGSLCEQQHNSTAEEVTEEAIVL